MSAGGFQFLRSDLSGSLNWEQRAHGFSQRTEFQLRIGAIREYVRTAAAGVTIGAALIVFAPVEIARAFGLENAERIAIKVALLAATVWKNRRGVMPLRS
jgi:hypothetical protein